MTFKKLALAAAVAALPATGFSMEAMEDSALSGVTGQDGISISLASDVTAGLKVHDKDGFTGNGVATADSGALVISGFAITRANTTEKSTSRNTVNTKRKKGKPSVTKLNVDDELYGNFEADPHTPSSRKQHKGGAGGSKQNRRK